MANLNSLQTVLAVAKQKEEQLALELKTTLSEQQKQEKYLNDLEAYRASYHEISSSKATTGVNAAMLRQYQSFLESIDHGISQQRKWILELSAGINEKRSAWYQSHQYSENVAKMIEKHEKLAEKDELKREQLVCDELNARRCFYEKK